VVERGQDVRRRDASSTIESEPCPEEPIRGGQLGSLYRPMEDAELVTKSQDLKLKGRGTTAQGTRRTLRTRQQARIDGKEHNSKFINQIGFYGNDSCGALEDLSQSPQYAISPWP
jgi:hypothetical protein